MHIFFLHDYPESFLFDQPVVFIKYLLFTCVPKCKRKLTIPEVVFKNFRRVIH